jgi:hypothetical protein
VCRCGVVRVGCGVCEVGFCSWLVWLVRGAGSG